MRQLISRTLAEGEFRLVIAMDHLEREGLELVVSDVYGEESVATKSATASVASRRWTEQDLGDGLDVIRGRADAKRNSRPG